MVVYGIEEADKEVPAHYPIWSPTLGKIKFISLFWIGAAMVKLENGRFPT